MNKYRIIIGTIAATAILVLASCAKDDNDRKVLATPGAPSETTGVSCDVIPLATVATTLGLPGLGAPTSKWVAPQRTCLYPLGKNPAKVILSYLSGTTRTGFDAERARAEKGLSLKTADVAGLGEAAYALALGSTHSLTVLKGGVRVMITSSSPLDREKQLAALIIAKL